MKMVNAHADRWTNVAFLGNAPSSINDPTREIIKVFSDLTQWVHDWLGTSQYRVSFLDSSTAACNAALLTLLPDCECILHTSSAHPTIRLGIETTAKLSGRFRGRAPTISEVDLRGIPLSSTEKFSRCICNRIIRLADNRPTVLVLEHVTYDHGLRLPITHICAELATSHPEIRIIIDGAQATGMWRPINARPSAYFGCFHKVVGAPPGTAFLAIEESLSASLPSHAGALCDLTNTMDKCTLQTVDLHKWKETSQILLKRFAVGDVDRRLAVIQRFNRCLDEALAPYEISHGHHDPQMRSHISSLAFPTDDEAKHAFYILAEAGYITERFGCLLRLSVGPQAQSNWAIEIGDLLRKELERTR